MTTLTRLRALLSEHGIRYLLVPSTDAHDSEYLAIQDRRREHVSGFDGSAGTALVGVEPGDNYLWTDGRYWLQAEQQLDAKEWHLMKDGSLDVLTLDVFLGKHLKAGDKVGVDPRLVSVDYLRNLTAHCTSAGATVEFCEGFVDKVWEERMKGVEKKALTIVPEETAGESVLSKLAKVAAALKDQHAQHLILTSLDQIAWLLNLRGADVPFNPVFLSFALVSITEDLQTSVVLFIDAEKVSPPFIQTHLQANHITVLAYEAFYEHISQLKNTTIWVDTSKCNAWTLEVLTAHADQAHHHHHKHHHHHEHQSAATSTSEPAKDAQTPSHQHHTSHRPTIVELRSPVIDMKAVKNDAEIEGMKQAHLEDGAALVEFFSWLETTVNGATYADQPLDEQQVAEKEYEFRAARKGFVGLSFETISSSGANAAIIHYKPPEIGSAKVTKNTIYLNDSGGQYRTGTTDVTRTWHFGNPSDAEKQAYTRVLIGFIALARCHFPLGVNGFALDVLARNALWQVGMDYKHGTGHGVGHFLNVHEMPPYIGLWRGQEHSKYPLKQGMCTSIEPGYYQNGEFGIRIENVAYIAPSSRSANPSGTFLQFDQFTMAPINTTLIIPSLMTSQDIQWLNDYHVRVRDLISPLVSPSAKDWLLKATEPI